MSSYPNLQPTIITTFGIALVKTSRDDVPPINSTSSS
jgi:hypothetical protein